jgi:glycosyltransferase involved in cell wall biosynthesis
MLSCYILTYNSERRLDQVLVSVRGLADEVVLLDSGSSDHTAQIADSHGARWHSRTFDNFREQRRHALSLCQFDWVLELDSDEVVSPALAAQISTLKAQGFARDGRVPDAYGIRREWYLLGQRIHCFYPSKCPDRPVRLFRRSKAGYERGAIVHEAVTGYARAEPIDEPILHYTCDSIDQMYAKVNRYTSLLAEEMRRAGVVGHPLKTLVMPWLLWLKFYIGRGGWRDGRLGWVHGRYVRDIVWQKYLKLELDEVPGSSAAMSTSSANHPSNKPGSAA